MPITIQDSQMYVYESMSYTHVASFFIYASSLKLTVSDNASPYPAMNHPVLTFVEVHSN